MISDRAYTIEDIMERWDIKTRKTAVALIADHPELHAYQINGRWYVEEKYLKLFIENLCKTGGNQRKGTKPWSIIISYERPWAYNHLKAVGLTDNEIANIIKIEKNK